MIVDDNVEMRTLIRSLLKNVAQEFVECGGGEEAVAAFPIERPDWTLMDIVMPGLDGLSATRRIKAQFPHARILAISNHDSARFRDLAREAGATSFVNKEHLIRVERIISQGV
jgi:CheY-like chemotaxis protein